MKWKQSVVSNKRYKLINRDVGKKKNDQKEMLSSMNNILKFWNYLINNHLITDES